MKGYIQAMNLARAIRDTYTNEWQWGRGEAADFRAKAREILEDCIAREGITGLKRQMLYEAQARGCKRPRYKRHAGRRNRKDRRPFWQVAVYDCNRAYGGPEEGGWWYDCGSRINETVETFYSEKKAIACWNEWNARLDKRQKDNPRANLSSVICTGRAIAYLHSGRAPEGFPDERPYYC
jgi:hypothetical protein